jgi:hypothetical protein
VIIRKSNAAAGGGGEDVVGEVDPSSVRLGRTQPAPQRRKGQREWKEPHPLCVVGLCDLVPLGLRLKILISNKKENKNNTTPQNRQMKIKPKSARWSAPKTA